MNLKQLYDDAYTFLTSEVGIIVCGSLVLLLLLYFVLSVKKLKKKKAFKRRVKDIMEQYDDLKLIPIQHSLARIEKIGKSNVAFAALFDEKNQIYIQMQLNEIDPFQRQIDQLNESLRNVKGKKLDHIINEAFVKIQAFSDRVHAFYDSLKDLTKEDEQARSNAFKTKENLRVCRSLYEEHEDELSYNEKVFLSIFDEIDASFLRFEEYLDRGQFGQASDLLLQLDESIARLKEDLTLMPRIAAFTTQVLPKRLNSVIDTYNEMRADGYPLHSLKITNTINDIKNELSVMKEHLNYLEYDGVNDRSAKLSESIDSVAEKLQHEKVAKVEFDKNYDLIYKEVEDLERRFLKIKRGSVDVLKIYLPAESFMNVFDSLQQEINILSLKKRDLDTYIHSSTPQPFSLLLEKLHTLDAQKLTVSTLVDQYKASFNAMKDEVEEMYTKCLSMTLKVKECESLLIDCQVDSFTQKYEPSIQNVLHILQQIRHLLSVQPIQIVAIREFYSNLTYLYEPLLNEIDEQVTHCRYAERAILLANKFYGDFSDVEQIVNRAEVHFAHAEFTIAMDITVELIERLYPGVYHQKLTSM